MKIKVNGYLDLNKFDITVWSEGGAQMPFGGSHTIEVDEDNRFCVDITESVAGLLNENRIDAIDNGRASPVTWGYIFKEKVEKHD
jgi:hypothetical protein